MREKRIYRYRSETTAHFPGIRGIPKKWPRFQKRGASDSVPFFFPAVIFSLSVFRESLINRRFIMGGGRDGTPVEPRPSSFVLKKLETFFLGFN